MSGRPIVWNAVIVDMRFPEAHRDTLAWLDSCRERGIPVYGQGLTTDPSFTFTLEEWNLWDEADPWRDCTLGTPEERLAKFADPARRAALKAHRPFLLPLENLILLKTWSERFQPFVNTRLGDAAPRAGMDIVDLVVDMVVEDGLKTLLQAPFTEESREGFGDLFRDPYILLGPSDGGAHTKFATSGRFPTETIELAVREKEWLSLEQAHFRLSALPARCAGFKDRGTLREGAPADVVVYDFENLTCLPEEVAYDFPGNEWRRICKASGYRHVMVNGKITLTEGEETGELPGHLLRHGAA